MSAPHPRLRAVVLDSLDARRAAEFWRVLLGYQYRAGDEPPAAGEPDPNGRDWLVLVDGAGEARIAFQQVDEQLRTTWPDQSVPQQLHLDLAVPGAADLERQHERVLELGGELRFDRSDDPDEALRVYTDPDGHPFCILVEG